MVRARRPSHHRTEVELLEISANMTATVNESIALVVQNVSIPAKAPVQTSADLDPDLTSRNLKRRMVDQGQVQ